MRGLGVHSANKMLENFSSVPRILVKSGGARL